MNKKYGVVVCSNAATDYIENPYNIPVFRSVIIFGDEKFDDYVDMKADEFYHRLTVDKQNFPHTAYVSIGKMISVFEDFKKNGYDGAIVITIARTLSGLNEAVKLAANEVSDFEVISYDSKTLAYPEALMALEAARLSSENKSLEEILARLDYIRDHNHIVFCVDTLEYLIKNGRLSHFVGAVAQMLKIRPLLEISKDGSIETLEKVRTSKKARDLMVKKFLEETKNLRMIPFLINTNNDVACDEIEEAILKERPDIKEVKRYLLTPVVGAHAGPGTVGLGYIEIEE